jgi:hypothetical protein
MSLVKKPEMTEKKVAANARNRMLARGPVTAEGKARIGAAQLRHGFYAKSQEHALRSLGEDPADYEELLQGLFGEFKPVGALQKELVRRMARVLWLMDRADRSQEGHALRRAKSADHGRDNRLHARMMRLKMTADSLRLLVQAVAREHYVTTPADLEKMKNLHQDGVMNEMGEIALALFYQLQAPGTGEDGLDPYEAARRMVAQAKEIFGIGLTPDYPPPANGTAADSSQPPEDAQEDGTAEEDEQYPYISAAEWEARERPRHLLENILKRQVDVCEAERKALLKESLAGPSPYEFAAEIAPSHAEALLMRRTQDANMREVRRLTNLLLKIQRQEHKMQGLEASDEDLVSHDVRENKDS